MARAACAALAGDWVIGGGTGGEGAAALEVFVDYVLCCEFHLIFFGKDRAGRGGARADCAQFCDLTLF